MIPTGVYLVGLIVVAFGVFGFFRGWRREIWVLGGLVIGWSLILLAGRAIVGFVNQIYLMLAFTFGGGFDPSIDATVLLDQLRARPLVSAAQPDVLYLVVLVLTAFISYGAASRFTGGPDTVSAQLLGVPVGMVNGYLLVYALLRFAGPAVLGEVVTPTARTIGQLVVPTLLVGGAIVALLLLQRFRLQMGSASRSRRP